MGKETAQSDMTKQGDAVVVHGLRGRPSNRKLPAETQRQAVKL